MDYKYKEENYNIWVERIKDIKDKDSTQICSRDIGLNELEGNQILSKIKDGSKILEIGCGNGLLYDEIKKRFQIEKYIGTDFVKELIDICNNKKKGDEDSFVQLDMTEVNLKSFNEKFDFIVSKRAIQNVIDNQLQIEAIDNFGAFLKNDGLMILVESSQDNLNTINFEREKYDLPRITPPFHNMFFDDRKIKDYNFKNVEIVEIDPFTSDFYFITRIIYARYAKEYLSEKTNYKHPLEKIALSMSSNLSTKDYAQVQTYIFKKK